MQYLSFSIFAQMLMVMYKQDLNPSNSTQWLIFLYPTLYSLEGSREQALGNQSIL